MDDDDDSMYRMTEKNLRKLCKERGMYQTADLNENCYFHCKGYMKIENIEGYCNCKSLWLQSNGIPRIENLDSMTNLICLFLQENSIMVMENLNFPNLKQLNLSNNAISKIEGLEGCPELESLTLVSNRLRTSEDLKGLACCKKLSILDLSKNQLQDEDFLEVFAELSELHVLQLCGNPIVQTMRLYRKRLLQACPNLTYVDDRPMFEDERRIIRAYWAGGTDAEMHERRLIQAEKRGDERAQFVGMQAFLAGKTREECVQVCDEERQRTIQRFMNGEDLDTGKLDVIDLDICCELCRHKPIWSAEEVDTVGREFFEQRVQLKFVQEEDVPELEYVAEELSDNVEKDYQKEAMDKLYKFNAQDMQPFEGQVVEPVAADVPVEQEAEVQAEVEQLVDGGFKPNKIAIEGIEEEAAPVQVAVEQKLDEQLLLQEMANIIPADIMAQPVSVAIEQQEEVIAQRDEGPEVDTDSMPD